VSRSRLGITAVVVEARPVATLHSTQALPLDAIKSITADPASLTDLRSLSDHRPVIARFTT
jgi:hypothetical protein